MTADRGDYSSLQRSCVDYLSRRQSTLWGQAWDINSPVRRDMAAKWLSEQIIGVLGFDPAAGSS